MFLVSYDATPVKNTKTVTIECANCRNTTEHQVYEVPVVGIGIVFVRRPLLAIRKYYLMCPTCRNAAKQITLEQVRALKQPSI